MKEPARAQHARKRVTEKRARRVRGAIGLDYLEVGREEMREAGLPRKNSSPA
jgi:hypothetical protein